MGQRANLVVVTETGYELYYCHWCANKIETMLFWGPKHALKAIRAQQLEVGWLDDVWAEGGVLMDLTKQTLRFFGGEELSFDIPLRKIFLSLMRYLWEGWEVRWASAGIIDIAKYVGVDEQHVRSPKLTTPSDTPISERWFKMPGSDGERFVRVVGSLVAEDNQIGIFLMGGPLLFVLQAGDELVKFIQSRQNLSSFTFVKNPDEMDHFKPTGGFHLDITQKRLYFWSANVKDTVDNIQPFWEGWDIIALGEDFEAHRTLTQNHLMFYVPDSASLLLTATQLLTRQTENSADRFKAFLNQLEQLGGQAIVNPQALVDAQSELDLDTKHVLIEYALQRWVADHPQDKQNGEQ